MTEKKKGPYADGPKENILNAEKIAKCLRAVNLGKSMLEKALAYVAGGLPVFPCHPDNKNPYISGGFKNASTNPAQIKEWWGKWPDALIGLPTGRATGFFVVDCDSEAAHAAFLALCPDGEPFPDATRIKTPRGRHYYFQMPDGVEVGCSAARLPQHVDLRGDGGYIIASGSVRADGGQYVCENLGVPPVSPPAWLIERVRKDAPRPQAVQGGGSGQHLQRTTNHQRDRRAAAYLGKALQDEAHKVASAPEGERNTTLFASACSLGELVAGAGLDEGLVWTALERAAEACGLPAGEAQKTIRSGLEAGKKSPRAIPEDANDHKLAGHDAPHEEGPATEDGNTATEEKSILPPPPPVPMEAFPPQVRTLIGEAAEAFITPEQVPAVCLLALISCLVGRKRAIEIKNGWREHGNTWLVLVGLSGSGKSPVSREFFQPVLELEAQHFQRWKAEYEAYSLALDEFRKGKKDDRGLPPVLPRRVQYFLDDSTSEALADALGQNPAGVTWAGDELTGLLANLDKYSGKAGGTKARLLSAHDGGVWKTSRRDPSKNLFIESAAVSLFGGIQPGMLARTFDGGDVDNGFLPRCMFIRAERSKPATWTEKALSAQSKALLKKIVERLAAYNLKEQDSGKTAPHVVPVSKEAKALFVEWFNKQALDGWALLNEGKADALSQKLKSHALRLCLLLHCLDAVLADSDGLAPIPADTMRRALLLADWVKENQAQVWRLFSTAVAGEQARTATPLELAIMRAIVSDAEAIRKSGGIITNERLVELVGGFLPCPVSSDTMGRVCAALKMPPFRNKDGRGRRITEDLIKKFERSVISVTSVTEPTATTISGDDTCKNQVSQVSPMPPAAPSKDDTYDTWEIKCHHPQSIDSVRAMTLMTHMTLDSEKISENGGDGLADLCALHGCEYDPQTGEVAI